MSENGPTEVPRADIPTATNVRRGPGEGFCVFCRRRISRNVATVTWGDGHRPDIATQAAAIDRNGTYYLCAVEPRGRGRWGGVCAGSRRALEEGRRPLMTAGFSPCRLWRYWLTRDSLAPQSLCPQVHPLVVIGLNPSTADETKDDPTVRRCIGFARDWGHAGLVMLNLFAFRATDPDELKREKYPIGPENDATLLERCGGRRVLCAWGANALAKERLNDVRQILAAAGADLVCLGRTASGAPRHPLYVPAETPPIKFQF